MASEPGDSADPKFQAFYQTFHERLEGLDVPGMGESPSWDRRAAYLLWLAEGNAPIEPIRAAALNWKRKPVAALPVVVEDDFGGLV